MANLVVQAGSICVLAMGLVFVLLLGEIDLSAGVAGGVSADHHRALSIIDHGLDLVRPRCSRAWRSAPSIGLAIGLLVARCSASRRSW